MPILRLSATLAFLVSLFSGPFIFAQSFTDCGTDNYSQQRMRTDSTYRSFVQNAKAIYSTDKATNDAILTIPVVFVVYHLGEPVGTGSNIPESALQAQVELMNREFGASLSLYADGGTDSRIRFVMARRSPDCTPFNGVHRVDGRSVPGYQVAGVDYKDSDIQEKLRNLAGPSILEMAQQAVVVRVYWRVTGAGGWAWFGGEIATSAPYLQNGSVYSDLMAHEMGHVFFLHHTFQGGDDNVNCPPNTNPLLEGDEVADTDPHLKEQPLTVCAVESESLINTCTGRPFGRIGRNIMSYGCRKYIFTPGQIARMRGYLAGSLNRFVNSSYAFPPTSAEALPAVACQPTSGLSSTLTVYQPEGIAGVRLGAMSSQTSFYDFKPFSYRDFSCTKQAVLSVGQSYSIHIDAPYNNIHRRVYVDWNNNGAFDEVTERAFSTNIGDESGLISVPANALIGQTLRMRVVVCDGPTAPTACFVPIEGAAQDFGLRLEPANTTARIRVGQLNSLSYCSGQSLLIPYALTDEGSLNTTMVMAELSDATGSFAAPLTVAAGTGGVLTAELPTTLPTGTAYRIRLLTTTPGIGTDETPPLTIRQTPTALLSGPATSIVGRPVPLTVSLTGNGPWTINTTVAPNQNDYSFPGQYGSLTVTSATAVLTGSPVNTATYWLATVESEGCVGGTTSNPVSVSVGCSPPQSLTETDPSTTSVYLQWENLGYRNYFVQWKESTATTWQSMPTTTYFRSNLTNLTLGRAYDWRVAISCTNSLTSAFSAPRSFTLTCPVPFGLYEELTPATATLGWNRAGATSSELRWRLLGAANWTVVPNLLSPIYSLPNPVSGQVYEWQVSNNCLAGGMSAPTPVRAFTVECGPLTYAYAWPVGSTTAVLNWFSVAGQQYTVRWRSFNAANWTVVAPTGGNSLTLTGLPDGQTIEWAVQTRCSDGSLSPFSTIQELYTNCIIPAPPTVEGLAATSVLVSWSASGTSAMYIQWRRTGTPGWSSGYVPGASATQFALTNLAQNAAYEVRLGPVGANGYFCGYTLPTSFTTLNCPLPALLTLTGPPTTLSDARVTLVASLSGLAPWSFTLNNGESFTNVLTSPFAFTTSFSNPNYYAANRYVGLAALSNACGTVDPFSKSITVQVSPVCGAPPANLRLIGTGTTVAYVTWDRDVNASSILLQWRVAGTSNWNNVPNLYTAYYFSNLTYGQVYEWRVQSVCSQGQPITPSAIQSFTLNCPEPYLLAETLNTTSAQLFWGYQWSSAAPVTYNLRWRASGNSSWTAVNNLNATAYTLPNLTINTAYEWQLQTICPGGTTTNFTPVRSFTTTCGMPATPYATQILPNSARANWTAMLGQTYALRYRVSTPGSWTNPTTLFTGTTATLSGLVGRTTYHVQVQAVCANGQRSPFSESGSFYTPCQTATAVLGGGGTISAGQTATLVATLLGSPPFVLTLSTGQSFSGISSSPFLFTVSPANTTTYAITEVRNTCGIGLVAGSAVVVMVQSCGVMQTIANGSWTDPAVWSCNRIPTSSDPVEIRHAVTLPMSMLHYALRLTYGFSGRLIYQTNARLRLGL